MSEATPQEVIEALREALEAKPRALTIPLRRSEARALVDYFDDLDKARAELLGGK